MQNFNGANIARVTSKGKRVGVVVHRQGLPPFLLSECEIREFGQYLGYTGQCLVNARVTVDGRIIASSGKNVQNIDKSKFGNFFDTPNKAIPRTQTAQPPITVTRGSSQPVAPPVQQNDGTGLRTEKEDSIIQIVLFVGLFVACLLCCIYFIRAWTFN